MSSLKERDNLFTGSEFKQKYGTEFYKMMNYDLRHYDFQYTEGLNVDTVEFDPTGSCKAGGLYFSKCGSSLRWCRTMEAFKIALVEIPDDANVYVEPAQHANQFPEKYKANKIIIKIIDDDEALVLSFCQKSLDGLMLGPYWDYYNRRLHLFAADLGHLNVLEFIHPKIIQRVSNKQAGKVCRI